jgi:hypothetical protein
MVCTVKTTQKSPEGDLLRGHELSMGWNQVEDLCLGWLGEARVIFR